MGCSFLVSFLLIPTGCSRSNITLEEQRKQAGIKSATEGLQSNAAVTFLELGSVNCIPCRMMQPVMKEIGKTYAGKGKSRLH